MKVILKKAGTGKGFYHRHSADRIDYTDSADDAQVFCITLAEGVLACSPKLPPGEWILCPVVMQVMGG